MLDSIYTYAYTLYIYVYSNASLFWTVIENADTYFFFYKFISVNIPKMVYVDII